jgi:glycosyl transferase family 2
MPRFTLDKSALQMRLSELSVGFAIAAYNEGDGILPTLASLWDGIRAVELVDSPIFLSDSSDSPELSSVEPTVRWAREVGSNMRVDHSDRRRSLKEALNVAFEHVTTDILVVVNADVIIPVASLLALLQGLVGQTQPVAAIGTVRPDPSFRDLRHRASAWQLRGVWRASSLMPRDIARGSFRSEGAFWGVRRGFYKTYRFPIGHGSIHDDIELTRALIDGAWPTSNIPEAFVYKVPAGSLSEFCSGTIRFRAASPEHGRPAMELVAAAIESIRDPIGAIAYYLARVWCHLHRRGLVQAASSEMWQTLPSTKRDRSGS